MKKNKYILIVLHTVFGAPFLCRASTAADSLAADSLSALPMGGQRDMSGHFYQVFLVTGILLLLLLGGFYIFKRLSSKSRFLNRANIRVLARHNIGPKQSVVIVTIEQKKYALGVTDHAVNLLAELGELKEEDKEKQPQTQGAVSFAGLLSRLKKEK